MSSQGRSSAALFFGTFACVAILATLHASDDPDRPPGVSKSPTRNEGAVKPKPLSDNVKKALAYLVGQQHADGGWGQGGGWRVGGQGGRIEGPNVEDPSDVANTCIATLALLRSGNNPRSGAYANNVGNAVDFICGYVGKADKDSLYVTDVKGTQVQSKIGPYVDTFLTALVLAELKGQMPTEQLERKLVSSLEKTVAKIEKHQKEDGTFAGNNGWASIFSQGLASKGLNRASQAGVTLKPESLGRAENNAIASIDIQAKGFKADGSALGGVALAGRGGVSAGFSLGAAMPAAGGASDAGVRLYAFSNQTAALQEAANTNKAGEKKAREILLSKTASESERQKARDDITRFGKVEEARQIAVTSVVDQLGDRRFVQGFGSNGGEEFLSYLNIGETLVVKGGSEWEKWDKSMTDNLNRIQNQDGSWSGDHCITGRTFCTASALLVLMSDRTPIPMATKLKGRSNNLPR
jgi:hypothetical protein